MKTLQMNNPNNKINLYFSKIGAITQQANNGDEFYTFQRDPNN